MAPFTELYAKFRGMLQESWQTSEVMAHFEPTSTLDTMFRYLWLRPEAQQVLVPPPGNSRISRKGAIESEKFRNEGNRLYRERKLEQALLAYNYSILAAPHLATRDSALADSTPEQESLALAYANRSAVLYEMGQYESALADIQRSLTCGYPPPRRHRLHERQAKCLHILGRGQEAKTILAETMSMLSSLSLNEKEAATVKSSLTKLQAKCETSSDSTPATHQYEQVFYTGPAQPPPVSSPQPDVPCLSDALRIHYTPIRGRHLVASRDIQPGEVLVVEEALAAVVKLDSTLRSHCSHCLRRCPVPLPCPSCSLVVFCSEDCLHAGVDGGHGAECRVLAVLVALQLDPAAALAHRILASTTLTDLRNTLATIQHEGCGRGTRPMMQVAHDYRTLYHLEGHTTARPECQLQEAAAVACVLTHILIEQCPTFLKDQNGHPVTVTQEDIVLVGGQIMRLILGLECNVHGTKEIVVSNGEEEGNIGKNRGQEVGWSVYSALSLVNHSCVPNTLTTSLGSTKFLYSVSIIPQGAEITDSYGERYVSHRRTDRRAALQQHYFFCCSCAACQADWPLFHELPMKPSMRCPSCCQALNGFTCRICDLVCTTDAMTEAGVQLYDAPKTQVQMNKYWAEYIKASVQINNGKVSPSLMGIVVNLLMLLLSILSTPTRLM
nr:SET and MYND domain-containing protein 4-like [Procambarus clarkii]XP_045606332.1 SET and MYND domain-containing protein 4-like [Procambarus clarkii]XP_045606341.1 SET and MYND domain-containing protein 4-like [Procambarus clarkii]